MSDPTSISPVRTVFEYRLPVRVEVVDGLVCSVTVMDSGPIRDAVLVEGEPDGLADAVAQASDGQPWPSWDYGG